MRFSFKETFIFSVVFLLLFCTRVQCAETAKRVDCVMYKNGVQTEYGVYEIKGSTFIDLDTLSYLVKNTDCRFRVTFENEEIRLVKGKNHKGSLLHPLKGEMPTKAECMKITSYLICDDRVKEATTYTVNGLKYIDVKDIADVLGLCIKESMAGSVLSFENKISDIGDIITDGNTENGLDSFLQGNYRDELIKFCTDYMSDMPEYSSVYSDMDFHEDMNLKEDFFNDFTLTSNAVIFRLDSSQRGDKSVETVKIAVPYERLNKYIVSKNSSLFGLNIYPNCEAPEDIVENIHIKKYIPFKKSVTREEETETTTHVHTVDPSKPMIALTFDDGPRKGSTELIVNALKQADGRATFFVVGYMVEANPELVKLAVDAGCQIGNHSYSHKELSKLSPYEIKQEINKNSNAVYAASGEYPRIGRPPYGSVGATVRSVTNIPWFNWNVDTLDWKYKDEGYVYNYVINNVKDGQVILMHDLHETTARAMVRAIPKLREMGYQLVTIDEMAKAKGGYENIPGFIED
ncbi:MAG TPA: hypothetical protein DCG28_04585 [Lachnospiraceae bacterium]|nr:hypothetical protein [Lachnospiraceae bacterium]